MCVDDFDNRQHIPTPSGGGFLFGNISLLELMQVLAVRSPAQRGPYQGGPLKNRSRVMTVVMLMAASFSCNDIGIDDDHSTISDPLSRWHAYRITSYSLKQSLTCFCVGGGVTMRVVVKDNRIVNVLEIATGNSIPQNRRDSDADCKSR